MFIPDPGSIVIPFFVATNFAKLKIILVLKCRRKKMLANFQRIIEFFTQKIRTMLSKIWVWDPGSGKNLFRIPDPGVKKAPDPGSGSATLGCSNQSFKQNQSINQPLDRYF
jgi:hypothetical protein